MKPVRNAISALVLGGLFMVVGAWPFTASAMIQAISS